MYIVLGLGLFLLLVSYLLPQKNALVLLRRIFRESALSRSEKYRIDLPQSTRLLWYCSIDIEKVPIVLEERNIVVVTATPLFGDQHEAHVDVPISSTGELKEITVRAVSSALEFEEKDSPSFLDVTGTAERRFRALPKVLGDGKVRFEFWHRGVLRGIAEKTVKVRSSQYGLTLPAGVALFLKIAGLSLSAAGAVISLLKLLHLM
jgi:hypothetical protein